MAEKDFRVKSGIIVGSLTTAGYVKSNASGTALTSASTVPTTDLSGTIANNQLANSSITVNGTSISLGGSGTVTANTTNALTLGTGLTASSGSSPWNGSAAITIAIDSTVLTTTSTNVITNKSLSDSTTYIVDNADNTKKLNIDVTGTTGITGTLQSTFTTAKTLVLPDAADTLVGKATTDTFTNKTFDTAGTGNVFKINGTQITAVTGSTGTAVLQTSPSITTSLTTGSTSFDLVNTTATTVNFAGAATTLAIGAATGTATINNATVTLANAATLNMNGANPTVASTATGTLTLFNANITTVNAFGAATTASEYGAATSLTIGGAAAGQTISIGASSTGNSTYNFGTGATASGSTKAVNIGTAGVSGSTTNVTIGSSAGGGTTTINSGTLVGAQTTQNVFNTVATTVNAFGAATTLSLGAGTGTTTVNNALVVQGNLTVNGTTTTINSTTQTLDDPIFTLGGDTAPTSDDNKDRGIEFRWHNGTAAKVGFFGFDDSTGYFTFIADATNAAEVFSGTPGDIQATNFRGALVGNADTATKLATARNISTTGDATWTVSFDGSANASASLTLATVNSNTGAFGDSITVPAITVNGKGLITAVTATTIRTGTTAQTGVLQLTDSISSTSTTTAATPNSVKTAYDLANAALPKSGGTMTGAITLKAGAAGAGAAPVYFQSGTNLTTAVSGAMEFDGTSLYFTPSTTRKTIAFTDSTMTGTWNGTAVGIAYGGTGATTASAAINALLPSQSGNSGKYLTTDGSVASWTTPSNATTSTTLSANTETAVDTVAKSGVGALEYTLFLQQGTAGAMKTRVSKVLVCHNSGLTPGATTSIDVTEHSIIEMNGAMAGINVTAKLNTSTSNIELLLTVTDASTTNVSVKFSKIVIS